jgi:hypothetical protein
MIGGCKNKAFSGGFEGNLSQDDGYHRKLLIP